MGEIRELLWQAQAAEQLQVWEAGSNLQISPKPGALAAGTEIPRAPKPFP